MIGWMIFKKSIGQIYYNFGDAVKASLLLWILFYASVPIVRIVFESIPFLANFEPSREFLVKYESWNRYLFLAVNYAIKISIVSLIAIIWHRFILLGKHSLRFFPVVELRSWLTYMKTIIPILLIGYILWYVIGKIVRLLFENVHLSYNLILSSIFIVTFVYSFVNLNIGLILPASAVDKPIGIFDSLRITRKSQISIIIFSVLLAGIFVLLNLGKLSFGFSTPIIVIISFFTGWLSLMIGISSLTTLYGYLVEKRDLT